MQSLELTQISPASQALIRVFLDNVTYAGLYKHRNQNAVQFCHHKSPFTAVPTSSQTFGNAYSALSHSSFFP
jgi:hypothetical protein